MREDKAKKFAGWNTKNHTSWGLASSRNFSGYQQFLASQQ
jgi:hypothetical protein